MMRSATFAAVFCIGQLFAAVPSLAASDSGDGPSRDRPAISADFGQRPYSPARSGSETTTVVPATWAAPESAIVLLPLSVETALFVTEATVLPSGFARGVERPPKPAL